MMHDHTLMALALGISCIGLVLMLFALFTTAPEQNIQTAADGAPITLSGTITSLRHIGNMTTLSLKVPTTIDAVIWDPITLPEGSCVKVSGRKTTYKGTPQVTVSQLTLC